MTRNESKLGRATVVAGFDDQAAAEEALLELRALGLNDDRIGYFASGRGGRMIDHLAGHHRFLASLVWGVVGGAIGAGAVLLLARVGWASPDPVGLAATVGICGALFLGTAGGLWGMGGGPDAAALTTDTPFVLAVNAGSLGGRVQDALTRRGGHELRPHAGPGVAPGVG